LHGLIKSKIKPTIADFNTRSWIRLRRAAISPQCFVQFTPNQSPVHEQVFAYADKISQLLMPKTKAYMKLARPGQGG